MDASSQSVRKKVLLIDDDQFLLSLYKKNAEQHPIELTTAMSGENALELLRGGYKPDSILLDINMPGMSGVDTLRAIRQEKLADNADVSVLSNVHQAEHENDFRQLGIQRFVPKSFLLPSQVLDYVVKGFGTDWAESNPADAR